MSTLVDRCPVIILRISVAALALLAGCAGTVTVSDGRTLRLDSPEFRDYVERVFREQNEVATTLAFGQEEASGSRYDALLEFEDALLAACAEINELAAARRDGRSLGVREQARMATTAPGCEATTQGTREALDEL